MRDHILERLRRSERLFADETTAPVLDPGRGRTKTGQLWAYARDDRPWGGIDPPMVAYVYAADRKGERAEAHLGDFAGILQVDGYGGYAALARRRQQISLAFCWAHVRRKFFELADTSPVATEVLRRIALLYAIEDEVRGTPAKQRQHIRNERSRVIIDDLHQYLEARIRRNGERVWRGKCASDPKLIAELIRKRAPAAERIVFETGPLSIWFYHEFKGVGLPVICIDARHAARALDLAPNKTDANDADGLAQLAEIGYFKEVRVKGFDSMLTRTLVAARTRLVRVTVELSNQIRGLMKTFGLVVPAGQGSTFEKNVRNLLAGQDELARIILPLLNAWRGVRERAAELGRQLMADARKSEACQILMSIPGIGTITATSFMAAIEDPDNFRRSRSVAAWLGLTTRRYQSGEVDFDGHISRRGDKHLRGLLYEAAVVIMTRSYADSGLRTWGLKLRERIGFKRAATALARKLAVTMHAMLKSGELFDPTIGATTV